MEIYIIELPKFDKYKKEIVNDDLNLWVKFINNPEVIDMENANKEINEAKKVLEEISNDKRERYLAELREKYIMDQKAIEDAGFDKGVKNEKVNTVRRMKKQKIDVEIISIATGLTVEEIQGLK